MGAGERRDLAGWLTPRVAAERLGVTDRTVVNRLRSGALAGVQLPNGRWRIDPSLTAPPPSPPPAPSPVVTGGRSAGPVPANPGEDVTTLLEVAMLRAENMELRAELLVARARIAELERDITRYRRVGERLLAGYELLYDFTHTDAATDPPEPF
jgi:hypothetical protein